MAQLGRRATKATAHTAPHIHTMAKEQEIVDTAPFITGEWGEPQTVSFNQRDLLTYAVGIGCDEMKFIYEGDAGFEPFPTYPVLLDMKGDTLDVDTAASSDMYLGTLRNRRPALRRPPSRALACPASRSASVRARSARPAWSPASVSRS